MAVIDGGDIPIGQPAPAPAPVMTPDATSYSGRECIFCHDRAVELDDIALLERGGPQRWCVCLRCFNRETADRKPISKLVAAQVAVEEKDLTLRSLRDHEKGGIM